MFYFTMAFNENLVDANKWSIKTSEVNVIKYYFIVFLLNCLIIHNNISFQRNVYIFHENFFFFEINSKCVHIYSHSSDVNVKYAATSFAYLLIYVPIIYIVTLFNLIYLFLRLWLFYYLGCVPNMTFKPMFISANIKSFKVLIEF